MCDGAQTNGDGNAILRLWQFCCVEKGDKKMATDPNITAPIALRPAEERLRIAITAVPVQTGVATKYWLELVQYPPGSARSLWLFVGGGWKHLDNPNEGIQISVQAAFCECPERLEVAVWYQGDIIVGLVVRSK